MISDFDFNTPADKIISWTKHHTEVFLSNTIAKERLVRYAQSHVDDDLTSKLHDALGGQSPRYDGIAQFWVQKEEDLIAVFTSDYYRTIVAPHEAKFIKESNFELYAGDFQVKWDKDLSTKS